MRRALSLLEVMIAVAVLGVVMSSVYSSIYTLDMSERLTKERAVVQQIARALSERVMGGTWEMLGQDVGSLANRNSWSWHRREVPLTAGSLLPMDETSANVLNRLDEIRDATGAIVSPAIVANKTGLRDLKVYLEYYNMDGMDLMLASPTPAAAWQRLTRANAADPNVYPDTGGTSMDLRPVLDAVLVRILVTWTPAVVGPRATGGGRYELSFARRK